MSIPDSLNVLIEKYGVTTFPRGQILAAQNKETSKAFLIKSGIVRVFSNDSQDGEISVNYLDDGDFSPLNVSTKNPIHLCSIIKLLPNVK